MISKREREGERTQEDLPHGWSCFAALHVTLARNWVSITGLGHKSAPIVDTVIRTTGFFFYTTMPAPVFVDLS